MSLEHVNRCERREELEEIDVSEVTGGVSRSSDETREKGTTRSYKKENRSVRDKKASRNGNENR